MAVQHGLHISHVFWVVFFYNPGTFYYQGTTDQDLYLPFSKFEISMHCLLDALVFADLWPWFVCLRKWIAIWRINKVVLVWFRHVATNTFVEKLIWALRPPVIFTAPNGVTHCLCGQLNHPSRVSHAIPDHRQRSFSCSVIAVRGETFNYFLFFFFIFPLCPPLPNDKGKHKAVGAYLWQQCSLGSTWDLLLLRYSKEKQTNKRTILVK